MKLPSAGSGCCVRRHLNPKRATWHSSIAINRVILGGQEGILQPSRRAISPAGQSLQFCLVPAPEKVPVMFDVTHSARYFNSNCTGRCSLSPGGEGLSLGPGGVPSPLCFLGLDKEDGSGGGCRHQARSLMLSWPRSHQFINCEHTSSLKEEPADANQRPG